MAKQIIVASQNKHKLKEIEHILKCKAIGAGISVIENGKTFEANAIKKAKTAFKKFGELTIADDSGLMVNCLKGKPGVKSARFATPPTRENLCKKLLKVMKDKKDRRAQFVCVIAMISPNGKIRTYKGVVKGKIIHEMRGDKGFGYDPLFVPQGFKKTFAEMIPLTKNRLSHRGRALQKAKQLLSRLDWKRP